MRVLIAAFAEIGRGADRDVRPLCALLGEAFAVGDGTIWERLL